jgi:hypothetical protein
VKKDKRKQSSKYLRLTKEITTNTEENNKTSQLEEQNKKQPFLDIPKNKQIYKQIVQPTNSLSTEAQ